MGYKLFSSKIQLFNDPTVSTKEKIGYCMKWLYDKRQKLKNLKREKNRLEFYEPSLSPAHSSYIKLKEKEGNPVSPEEIAEFELISKNQKLQSLEYLIKETETSIESLEAELAYWQNYMEIEGRGRMAEQPTEPLDERAKRLAKRIASKRKSKGKSWPEEVIYNFMLACTDDKSIKEIRAVAVSRAADQGVKDSLEDVPRKTLYNWKKAVMSENG